MYVCMYVCMYVRMYVSMIYCKYVYMIYCKYVYVRCEDVCFDVSLQTLKPEPCKSNEFNSQNQQKTFGRSCSAWNCNRNTSCREVTNLHLPILATNSGGMHLCS